MKKRSILFVSILLLVLATFTGAAIFEDNDSSDFSQGNFYRTFYNVSGFVQLNNSQGFSLGNFSSRIFDAGLNSTWSNISWTQELCYGCELPNNGIVEQGDFVRPLNMSGNVLLAHMDELSGDILDYSGYSNTGVVTLFEGNEYNSQGKFNKSLDFEANDGDLINFSSPQQYNFGNQITLEAWVRPESFDSLASQGSPTFIDKDPGSISFYFNNAGGTGDLTGLIVAGNSLTASGNTVFNVNTWYHVAMTYNGSQVRLYTNGLLDGTPRAKTGNIVSNNKALLIGAGWDGSDSDSYRFDGLIDEVAIYNRSLSAQEIQDRYLRGALRLNLSVRSCDDSSCSGESYTQINGQSPQNLSLISNNYFNYKFEFSTENTQFTPKLYNATISSLATNIAPTINLTYPSNNTNYTSLQTLLNYTVFDNELDSCWYTLNSGTTNNSVTCGENLTSLSSNQGINIWRVYANDSSGAESSSYTSFFIDSIAPTISIVNPLNNTLLTTTLVRVNYTVSDSGVGLNRCWWTNSSGAINNTIICGNNFTFTGNEGTNFIRIYSNDTFGNLNSQTNTFVINTQAPTVNIVNPASGSVVGIQNGINLNFSAIDPLLQSCWYTLTEGFSNTSIPGCQNTTFNVNSDGLYEVILYANDTTGNIGFDSNTFTVSVDAPSINPLYPIDQYLGNQSTQRVNFTYTPVDLDLQSCSLWINTTGTFSLNQTNNTLTSGQESSFFLNLSNSNEGAYSWAISCNDTLAHNSITGNQTFHIDRTKPNVTVNEPSGTYSSLTNIPISLMITDYSPVQCYWNVTFAATGNLVIGNSELANCEPTTFTLDTESSYFLWMSVTDSAGNVNITRRSFTVDVPAPSSGSSGGGGGGGSSGGSGGRSSSSVTQSFSAELENIDKLKIRRGESEIIEIPVKNSGLRFLNNCLFVKDAGVSEWISGQEVYSLSPGQTINYVFSVNVPVDAEVGDYFVTLGVKCQEVNSSFTYQIEVIGGEFELSILSSERVGSKLRVNYAVENFGNIEKTLSAKYRLINSDNEVVAEGQFSSLTIDAEDKAEFESDFELPRNSIGDYTLVMELSDNLDISQKQQTVRLTTGGVTGFAISDNNLRTIAWFGIVVLIVFGMFIVVKIIRNQIALRRAIQNERQFITIDLN